MTARFSCLLLLLICLPPVAEVIDPEKYILEHGYQKKLVDDQSGATSYSSVLHPAPPELAAHIAAIKRLPKDPSLMSLCELIRGNLVVGAVNFTGDAADAAISDYGYEGDVVACAYQLVLGASVISQVTLYKENGNAAFMLFLAQQRLN